MHTEWLVIINPNAGKKTGLKDWPVISSLLEKHHISFTHVFTTHRDHAIYLASTFIQKGFRKIIVAGGDGTLNEVVNGIFRQKACPSIDITLGMISIGTGNDWGKTYNIPMIYEDAIQTIKKGSTKIQDTGIVWYTQHQNRKKRYFINVAGMGFDAVVAHKTNLQKDKGKGNKLSYLINILTTLFYHQYHKAKITIDDQVFEKRLFTAAVGICQYNGGGMRQLPMAIPDDGLLDITFIRKLGKLKIIRSVHRLYDGSFIRLKEVQTGKAESITIESSGTLSLEADGESLGTSPFEFSIVPRSIKIISC